MLSKTPLIPKKLAIAVGILSSQAFMQANAQSPDGRLEEIIVTSQKRAQSLQDVPISVAAVTGDKLADAGIENLDDLTSYLPNIHFTESGISTQVRIRGIGSDNSQGFEQSVGMYIDGIYYGRAQLFRTPMMDMERVELLRGPQSILFGKNSIAGALNLATAKPTDEFEGKVSVSHEFEHNQDEVNAVISGPLTENLRARVAVRTYEEDGYFFNTFKEVDEADTEEQAARITLDWTPTDTLAFTLKAEKNEFETKGRPIEVISDVPQTAGGATFAQTLGLLSAPVFDSNLNYQRQADANEFSDNEITNITLTTSYEFNDHTLTFVTGKLSFDYTELCDCDFTSAEILNLELFEDYDQFSQEIRITSPLGETFEWIGGLFYQDYDQTFRDNSFTSGDNLLTRVGLSAIANTSADRRFEQSSEAWAVFGQVTWNISDSLRATFGARYTQEDKEASKVLNILDINGQPVNDPVIGFTYLSAFVLESEAATVDFTPGANFGQPLQNSGHNISAERDESAFTPLVIVEYDFTPDTLLYASFTTGFKAGGFDPRSNSVGDFASSSPAGPEQNPTRNFEFEEETAVAAEIGIKTSLADGRGELNVSLYRTDYEDLQISQFDGGAGFNVGNAGETRVQGIEVDGRWLLTDGLTGRYGISFLDFEYTDFPNGNCNLTQINDASVGTADLDGDGDFELCNYTGRRGVYTPEYTVNLGLDYFTPITDSIDFVSFIDVQQVDGHNVHVNLDPIGEIDSYTLLSLRVGLEGEKWSVGVLGKNLLDEEVLSYAADLPLSASNFNTSSQYAIVRRPATVALEATLKF